VGATFWGIETQKKDALVINMAGRQRMLIQLMTRLAIERREGKTNNNLTTLVTAANTFEQTLFSLRNGGETPYLGDSMVELPPTKNAAILSQLDQVVNSWESYRAAIEWVVNLSPGDLQSKGVIQNIEDLTPVLVEQADGVVRLYETESTQKLARLRNLQIGFFIGALIFLGLGIQIIRKSVLQPLDVLGARARSIGAGNLNTSLALTSPQEMALLDRIMDQMQTQIRVSRDELITWTETLEERVGQRTQVLDALYEISRDISSRLNTQDVLDSVTQKARQLLGGEIATLCLLSDQDEFLLVKAHSGPAAAVIAAGSTTQSSLAQRVLSQKQVHLCQRGDCQAACQVLASQFRASHLVAPLWVEDQVIGVLCVGSSAAAAFSGDAIQLLTRLANSAAIALKNARLYAQAERAATLEERRRIAADMHDSLGQTISRIGLNIDMAEKHIESEQVGQTRDQLISARNSIDRASGEVRSVIAHLLDDSPVELSLQNQIETVIKDLPSQANNEVNFKFHNGLKKPVILRRKETEQVLRVVSESLNNAGRHANATCTRVLLQQNGTNFELSIEDNGQGFDPKNLPDDGCKHFGLQIMQARATHLGGDLWVDASPGQGTRITLCWPISHPSQLETS